MTPAEGGYRRACVAAARVGADRWAADDDRRDDPAVAQPAGEAGLDDFRVLAHVLLQAAGFGEKLHVAQLVDLVRPDGEKADDFLEALQVIRTGAHKGNAAACVGDFGGGGKLQNGILSAEFFAQLKNIGQLWGSVREVVNRVSVVPDDAELLSLEVSIVDPPVPGRRHRHLARG